MDERIAFALNPDKIQQDYKKVVEDMLNQRVVPIVEEVLSEAQKRTKYKLRFEKWKSDTKYPEYAFMCEAPFLKDYDFHWFTLESFVRYDGQEKRVKDHAPYLFEKRIRLEQTFPALIVMFKCLTRLSMWPDGVITSLCCSPRKDDGSIDPVDYVEYGTKD